MKRNFEPDSGSSVRKFGKISPQFSDFFKNSHFILEITPLEPSTLRTYECKWSETNFLSANHLILNRFKL